MPKNLSSVVKLQLKKLAFPATSALWNISMNAIFMAIFLKNITAIQKRGIFEHQKRISSLIDTEKPNPDHFILEIGDLTDIIQLTTPKEFNEQLSFKLPQ